MRAEGASASLQLAALRGDARALRRWRPRPRPRPRPRARPGGLARHLGADAAAAADGDDWPWDAPGDTPLHCAARAGDTATVEALLAEGADATAPNGRREKPLEAAAAGGHVGSMRALVRCGAARDAAGVLRALWAARGADEVRALVEASPGAVRAAPPGAAWQAAWDGRAGALEALLAAGADANAADPLGWTPLHRAAYQGATALHLAVLSGQEDAIRVLLQAGGGDRSHDVDMDCEGRSDAEGDSDSEVDCEVLYPFIMESPLSV